MSKLKRVVIKEELVWLTGDFIKAAILQQFLYWTERMKDIDAYITQENKRLETHGYEITSDLTHGWIYKTAEELSEETMLNLSVPTIRTHIKYLINKGYLYQRKNPKYKWDQTTQYRIDLIKISHDLLEGGYHLEGYNNFKLQNLNTPANAQKIQFKNFKMEDEKIHPSELKNLNSELKNLNSSLENLNAIPEITTEITTDSKSSQSQTDNDKEQKKETKSINAPESNNDLVSIKDISKQSNYIMYEKIIKENIEYDYYKKYRPLDIDLIDELILCMLDIILTENKTVKINGEDKNRELVKNTYLKINSRDIEHIIERYKTVCHKITHLHAYLKTMLFTCKQEQGHFYTNAVRVDGIV